MTKENLERLNDKFKQDIFPENWVNPKSAHSYDLLILGGGPGGMTAATVARRLNARVALVEKRHLGGECLSYGCIPSKAFLRSSRALQEVRIADEFGLEIPQGWKVNFQTVMERVRRLQTIISPHDSAEHFKNLGVDVFLGTGRFTGRETLEVSNQTIHFKKAIIATGTEPAMLSILGLQPNDCFTNETIFNITSLPRRLAVIGAGPISCELSQAFLRFGSQVHLLTHGAYLLSREEKMARERLREIFEKEGMRIYTNTNVVKAEKNGREKILYLDSSNEPLIVDEILMAVGRKPAIEGLNLEKAGISYDEKTGILTNAYMQTSNSNIYAAGDVASKYKFTHMSKELSKIAVHNAFNGNQEKSSSLIVPWCTYTDPEIGHIGMTEEAAIQAGIRLETVVVEMKNIDRAILDGETTGFVKLLVKENEDEIIGATIMAKHAGDMLSEISVAMQSKDSLSVISRAIHSFPTQAEVLRVAADLLKQKRKKPSAVLV